LQAVEIIQKEFSHVIIPAEAQRFPVSYKEREKEVTKHRNLNDMYIRKWG